MKIILDESRFCDFLLKEYNISDGNADHNPYAKKIGKQNSRIKKFIEQYGTIMVNIENGGYYFVYELYSLAEMLGTRYVLCRKVGDDGKASGAMQIRPMDSFKIVNY